jgi:hypothetical protein
MADASIPRFRAERSVVPNTYDADRRPGSSGQRYFSDMQYANPNMAPREFDDEAAGYETQAAYDTRFNNSMDAAIDAARTTNTAQANQLGIANLANKARDKRPAAQTLTDTEVVKTFTDIDNNPAYDTERKVVEQGIGAMNQYNISPERASELTGVPLNDVNAMMSPYYTAFGETKPEGIADLIATQKDLVAAADERLPYMTQGQEALYSGVQNLSVEDAAKLIDMGIFSPEQAAQFYQSRYPGITASDVRANMRRFGYEGYGGGIEDITLGPGIDAGIANNTGPQQTTYAQGGIASVAPQGQGYYLGGATDGMADQIPATIDNSQPAALSDGEFVIPADVVSHLGNGNSTAGATQLHGMMDKVRQARTGSTEQGREINPNKFLA